ncbi:MAG: ABC transporter ATP-binding protein [Planctomycetota bacterium]|jgi:iron complex transport system ATP-binding protein|nr:ABC transporter ATP-binding protein [Planctomycetota bacterium]
MTDDSLLRAVDLSFSAGGKSIISGVSFAMRPGEFRAVIGRNGAGKSTLARRLAGLAPGGGEVRIRGRAADSLSRRELAREICYLPQIQERTPAFSVRDYVMLGRYPHTGFWRGPGRGDRDIVQAALEMTGLAGLADRPLPTLSGGERQLAAIAGGLAQEAVLLILDEPAAFLDPFNQSLLLACLGRLNRVKGVSLLVITHDVNLALLFAQRALALKSGRVVFDGPPGDLTAARLHGIFDIPFASFKVGAANLTCPLALLEAGA